MKLKYFLFLFLTLTIFHQTSSIATVRYVSKTGNSQPPYTTWKTAADSIQKCINICLDGDTVYVANGIYKEFLVINPSISLFGMSMDSTVIDGRGLGPYYTVRANADQNITGLKIIGKGFGTDTLYTGISTNGHNLIVSNCNISNANTGIYISSSSGTINNVIITNAETGIMTFCGYDTCKPIIKNSVILIKPQGEIGIENFHGGQPTITNNIIIAMGYASSGLLNAIPIYRWTVSNNLISGFDINIENRFITDSSFLNFNNSRDYIKNISDFAAINSVGNRTVLKGNIVTKNYIGVNGSTPNADYNLYWNNFINATDGSVFGDGDVFADPMFVKDSVGRTLEYDYHLQKYSPAIDAGDPNILDVDGSRSDIGIFGGPLGQVYTYLDLAPKPPGNLTATMDSGLVHLKWNKNTEADLFRYRIYRDTVPDFIYDTTKIIAVISDTIFYDDPPQKFISGNYYYKITAIDSAYHQSSASEEVHINITGIPEAPPIVVEHYNLLQNYPNPFNPSTTIPYRLKAPGYVKVMVYNILGELVKVLVNKYQSAGYYEVQFNPTTEERKSVEGYVEFETFVRGGIVSGIYLYRIEVIGEGNIPVFMEMKKMMLIK